MSNHYPHKEKLRDSGLKGAMKAAKHKRVDEHLDSAQVVVATG